MAYSFGFGSSSRYRGSRYNKELTPAGRVFMVIIGMAFVILPFSEFNKYDNLAKNGREAEAKVISYNPTYTHNKHGTTTHHWHMLFYEGSQKRVELKRPFAVDQKIFIVYDPSNPATAAEGRKGMEGKELMGGDYITMWLMVMMGLFIAFMAFVAPSKSGTSVSFNTTSSTGAMPESLSGLEGKTETKTFTYKKEFKANIGSIPGQGTEAFSGGEDNTNTFKPAIETAIAFTPGGPEQEPKAPQPASGFSKYGIDVMDEGYRLFKDSPEFAAAALAEKFGHLTVGQAKEVIAKADALDYAADDEANNVQSGLYTAEKAAANLMKTNPGFSEQLYLNVVNEKMKS